MARLHKVLREITPLRWFYVFLALSGLTLVYLFQRVDYLTVLVGLFWENIELNSNTVFAFNRVLRYIINDFLAILLIYALFDNKRLVQIAFIIQVTGLLLVMVPYLIVKLNLEGDTEISSPLLSFWHRMIVNPVLILLLIPANLMRKV